MESTLKAKGERGEVRFPVLIAQLHFTVHLNGRTTPIIGRLVGFRAAAAS
jgi:hypothetical protein